MNPVQQLKEDYELRAKTVSQFKKIHPPSAVDRHLMNLKESLYREFAHELSKLEHLGDSLKDGQSLHVLATLNDEKD